VLFFVRRFANQDAGATANAVERRLVLDQGFHFQELTKLSQKGWQASMLFTVIWMWAMPFTSTLTTLTPLLVS